MDKAAKTLIGVTALAVLAGVPASSQHMQATGDATMHTVHQPYRVETFGVFRKMMLEGDFNAKTSLAAAMSGHPTTGVGAVAGARGEITVHDGKLVISYGRPGEHPDADAESAALLAIGSAGEWQSVTVASDVSPAEIEAYLAATAKGHGIDPEKSFPFEVHGGIASYAMHVNAAPTDGPHGMGLPMAITVERKGDSIDGFVAGLYVSPDLVGIATHGGERMHAHWVAADRGSTAHLDRWGLKAGSILMLPRP